MPKLLHVFRRAGHSSGEFGNGNDHWRPPCGEAEQQMFLRVLLSIALERDSTRTKRQQEGTQFSWLAAPGGFIIIGIMLVCIPLKPERTHHGALDRMFWVTQAASRQRVSRMFAD